MEIPKFFLLGTPPTCKLFNITIFGRTLKGPKEPLIQNYEKFKNIPFTAYQGPFQHVNSSI